MSSFWGLVATTFLASAVEAVEMVTIVLGVGVTRGWRSSLFGAGIGMIVLIVLGGALGTGLSAVPIVTLRLFIGALLLIFGLQWLGKAIPRVAARGFRSEGKGEEAPERSGTGGGVDWTAFVLCFKGVVLEGLEILFIVVSFGAAANHRYVPAGASALAALLVIAGIGAAFQSALGSIPRRVLQLVVGGMLATFGTFWSVEGLRVAWPFADVSLAFLFAFYAAVIAALLFLARARQLGLQPAGQAS